MATETGQRRLKFWGWGYEDQQPPPEQVEQIVAGIGAHLGFGDGKVEQPPSLDDVELPPPRLVPSGSVAHLCSTETYDRAAHAYGKAYRDIVRAFRGRFDHPPDVVAYPEDESQLEAILDWCADENAAAIPYGGGTSVVGGVEPRVGDGYEGIVTIDLRRMDRVLEVDTVSRAARIQAGAIGPVLEDQLREHGLTLRHFPQSFEYSTLGGWIATRAGGHFATLYTHIDDLVESVRALTPRGMWESRRLPGSGAGPSPDRLLLGSEGILGVITEAWVRVQERPAFKASAGVRFGTFEDGATAVRALTQSGLHPSNCRLLDNAEAALTGATPDGTALLVLGFESSDHELGPWIERALELCGDHGGSAPDGAQVRAMRGGATGGVGSDSAAGTSATDSGRGAGGSDSVGAPEAADSTGGDSVGAWRNAFVQAPYLRDHMVAAGIISDTFETAITWDRLGEFVADVRERAEAAVSEICGDGKVTCRFTHAYPDGAAPYFTVLAPARRGSELVQWDEIKAAASEAVIAAGGTITHHHAVGRDHRPWYDRQRPDPFAEALRAAKAALDPNGILNPGVLIDPVV